MSAKNKIYFASDFHLGAPNHKQSLERERCIVSWLDEIKKDASEIYLVGDIFDFWYEWKSAVPRGYVRILGKLAEICDSGTPIHFFTGNHDLWTFGYLEEEIGLKVYRNPIEVNLQGEKCFIGHGDGLGPGDYKYKMLKNVFTSKLCQWLFSRLHPNASFGLANYFSSKSRIANIEKDAVYSTEENEWLYSYSKEILEKKHFDYFIFGHRHLPLDIQLSDSSRYINLGEWVNYNSFGVLENGKFELKFYNSKFTSAINKN
jgi:UDP-2,3-diacylglucosamine hydrolase